MNIMNIHIMHYAWNALCIICITHNIYYKNMYYAYYAYFALCILSIVNIIHDAFYLMDHASIHPIFIPYPSYIVPISLRDIGYWICYMGLGVPHWSHINHCHIIRYMGQMKWNMRWITHSSHIDLLLCTMHYGEYALFKLCITHIMHFADYALYI